MTLAILTNHLKIKRTIEEVREDLEHFVNDREPWCKDIAEFYLDYKNRKWENYKQEWLHEAFPLDQVGITFFARCYRRHICVFFNTHLWTTHKDNDIKQCTIFLVYRGSKTYWDSREMTADEAKGCQSAIGRIQAMVDEKNLAKNVKQMVTRKRKRDNRISSESELEGLDMELLLEESSTSEIPEKSGNNMQNVTTRCSVSLSRVDDLLRKEIADMKNKSNGAGDTSGEAPKSKRAKLTQEIEKEVQQVEVDIGNNMRNSVKRITTVDIANKSLSRARNMRKGSWSAVVAKQKKQTKLKEFSIKCPAEGCSVIRESKAKIRKHLSIKHPDFRWVCRKCTKDYASREGRYKHELKHKYGSRFMCKIEGCGYRCLFESEMMEHVKKQTNKGLFKCRIRGCDKAYPAKRTRNSHEKTHDADDWTCAAVLDDGTSCGQECMSKNHLNQHERGSQSRVGRQVWQELSLAIY